MSTASRNSRPTNRGRRRYRLSKRTEPRLAYIRAIKSEVAASLHPAIPLLALGPDVFVLHAADGTLIAVADTREAAVAGAATFKLEALSLH
jgi:hypothetical protein